MTQNSQRILVLGNGPSLKKYSFNSYQIPTIGMNIAFRYWEKINWYPTYYACLDNKVTEEHHEAIYKMVQHQDKLGIKKFFLRRRICDFHPDLKRHPNILFAYEIGPKSRGFSNYKRKTTGSWSVRWAIYMGYTTMLLLGIDCHYVPLLKSTRSLLDSRQKLRTDIENNQNYFFDEYQKKGDKIHIPSKGKEDRELHIESFQHLAKETRKNSKIQIINCNTESKIHMLKIFPYRSIEEVLVLPPSAPTKNIQSKVIRMTSSQQTSKEYFTSLNLPKIKGPVNLPHHLFLSQSQVQKLKQLEALERQQPYHVPQSHSSPQPVIKSSKNSPKKTQKSKKKKKKTAKKEAPVVHPRFRNVQVRPRILKKINRTY